jgi:hypothetical protein
VVLNPHVLSGEVSATVLQQPQRSLMLFRPSFGGIFAIGLPSGTKCDKPAARPCLLPSQESACMLLQALCFCCSEIIRTLGCFFLMEELFERTLGIKLGTSTLVSCLEADYFSKII